VSGGTEESRRRLPLVLGVVVAGMFGFGFAMVPLYNLLCEVAGINGLPSVQGAARKPMGVDTSREILVEFDATIHADLPWVFKPTVPSMKVHPGQVYETTYYAENRAAQEIIGQAIPSITPWQATEHFNKNECFCFTQQTLAAGEGKEMKLRFVISPDLPEKYRTVTLSYTFMDAGEQRARMPESTRAAREKLLATN